jgi:hypothetical protein
MSYHIVKRSSSARSTKTVLTGVAAISSNTSSPLSIRAGISIKDDAYLYQILGAASATPWLSLGLLGLSAVSSLMRTVTFERV